MANPPNGAPVLTVDQKTMLEAVRVVAQQIMAGRVSSLGVVITLEEGVVIGHHVPDGGDPYRLRGCVLELLDQVREAYIKKPESGLVDGTGAKIG